MLGASATLVEEAGDFKRVCEGKFAFCDQFLSAPNEMFAICERLLFLRERRGVRGYDAPSMHLRPPSIDQGVQAFLWALGLGLFIWLGLLAIGVSGATSFILAAVGGGLIFLYVRIFGEEDLRR